MRTVELFAFLVFSLCLSSRVAGEGSSRGAFPPVHALHVKQDVLDIDRVPWNLVSEDSKDGKENHARREESQSVKGVNKRSTNPHTSFGGGTLGLFLTL